MIPGWGILPPTPRRSLIGARTGLLAAFLAAGSLVAGSGAPQSLASCIAAICSAPVRSAPAAEAPYLAENTKEMIHAAHELNGPTYAHAILNTRELIAALPLS